ncbi:hypothetical protein JOQ06_008989 [Pogonophryne albipinna]|uniref:Uncharacterized protein n=1 Tax=Pogonophryne albipinna TaxID=1090488 RepID=A0AAD6BPM9_9TELE|nr:hypothetical protein JOQ06_008989 [Pogonophryne albipinna]
MEFAKKRKNVAVIKSDNLKRHFTSIHAASFNANYPEKSDQRTQKIAGLLASYKHSVSTMSKTTSAQESATAASLHVSWTLARAKKPFADAELIKRCAIDMTREVLNPDKKQQKKVVELLKQVPLSANTATKSRGFSGGVFFQSTHRFEENRGYIPSHRFVL